MRSLRRNLKNLQSTICEGTHRVVRDGLIGGTVMLMLLGAFGARVAEPETAEPEDVVAEDVVAEDVPAEDVATERILIRDVQLIGPGDETESVIINILVVDGELGIVTRDEIPAEEADLVVDGLDRVVLGLLDIGEPADFLIIDQDPRDHLDVLFDTKDHIVFAMRHGVVIAGAELLTAHPAEPAEPEIVEPEEATQPTVEAAVQAAAAEPEESTGPETVAPEEGAEPAPKKKFRWIAYTPPPMALPITYRDSSRWNEWETRHFSGIFLGMIALDRQYWVSQDAGSEELQGDLKEYDGGDIRVLRFGAVGTLNFKRPWVYTLFATTSAFDRGFDSEDTDSLKLFDYRIDIPLSEGLVLSAGRQKEPISMQRLMVGFYLPMLERSAAVDAMLPSRNVGLRLSGKGLGQRFTWAAGVFNDWYEDSQSFGESDTVATGRFTWLPLLTEDESQVLHLGLGLRYSSANEGVRYAVEPEFKQAPLFVDTGLMEAGHTFTYDLEAAWRRGPIAFGGEYLRSKVDAPHLDNPAFSGYHITASWIVTGEVRPLDKRNAIFGAVPVSKPVDHGGPGAWEISVRYSSIDLDDGEVEGGRMDILSLGLAWYLSPTFHLRTDYRMIDQERLGIGGRSDGVTMRLVLMLE